MNLFISSGPLTRMQRKLIELKESMKNNSSALASFDQLLARIQRLQETPAKVPESFSSNAGSYGNLLRSSWGIIVEDWLTQTQHPDVNMQHVIEQANRALDNCANWLEGGQINSNTATTETDIDVSADFAPRSGPFSR